MNKVESGRNFLAQSSVSRRAAGNLGDGSWGRSNSENERN